MAGRVMPKLGKQEHKPDDRTLRLAHYFLPEIYVPGIYDFDRGKRPFPSSAWGNYAWGNCVICGEANHVLRMERIEQRRTLRLTDSAVIGRYKGLTGAEKPGDDKDIGLVVLNAMRNWRNIGWQIGARNYTIAAYGEIEPEDAAALRRANYIFHGVHMGFSLPLAVQEMPTRWDYKGETGSKWRPGSWGGHLVYSKAYNTGGLEIITWGEKVFVTNAFIERYCDEAWAVVDSLDDWKAQQTIDVDALTTRLREISHAPINR